MSTGEKKAKEEQAKKSKMKVCAAAAASSFLPCFGAVTRLGCVARLLVSGISFLIGDVLLLLLC